jgi:hypothetical protein
MPSPFVRRHQRAALRSEAAEAEDSYRAAMAAAAPAFKGKLAPPPTAKKERTAWGTSEYRRAHSGEYDWFEGLSKSEQARLRENWFASDGASPDEMEAMGLPVSEWLSLGRGIDAAKAVRAGRTPQPARYGGRDPLAFLMKGRPEDHGKRVSRFTSKRNPSRWHDIDQGAHVQYFEKDGVVHPIRSSYRRADSKYLVGAGGQLVKRQAHRPEDDEAF